MSWDFSMEPEPCPTCGHVKPDPDNRDTNYTYNVAPMFYEAFGEFGIRGLDGLVGSVCALKLQRAIFRMEADPDKYKAMNPENGWGNYEGALELLRKLLSWCEETPGMLMRVS